MLSHATLSLDSIMLDEARAYLRLENDVDDPSLGISILAAIAHAERFTGRTLIRRQVKQILTATAQWQLLGAVPVRAITGVTGIPAEGSTFALSSSAYKVDIDAQGEGHLRVTQQGSAGRVEIEYEAGIATGWGDLPEGLRFGILRLIGHYYAHRDAKDDSGPPTAVAALLRPWRRMRLSSGQMA